MRPPLYIGLTGRMASGKGEVIKRLQKRGFLSQSLSDLVREEAEKLGGNFTREQLQDLGNRMRNEEGAGVLGKRVREKISRSSHDRWVIDGIRNPAEIAELRKLTGFYLIGIDTDPEILLERMKRRKRQDDRESEEILRRNLAREWGEGEPPGGQQVGACMGMSDYIISNNSSFAGFIGQIEETIQTIEANHAYNANGSVSRIV